MFSSSYAVVQFVAGLVIGLIVDISAASETVDICSDGTTHITGRSVNISSPSYPSLHRIRNNITCCCHVTTGQNSRADIRIEPKDIAFNVNDIACYASIELWSPVDRVDRKFCLNSPSKNFNNTAEFKSVFLINITYQAFRPRPRNEYQGKFLISFTASRATNLLLMCTSFPSTSTATVTQVISSTSRSTYTTTSSSTSRISSTKPISSGIQSSTATHISSAVRRSSASPTNSSRPTNPVSSEIPISSTTTIISTTIPFSSTTPVINTTIPISSTPPILSTIIPISSTTPIISTTILVSTTSPIVSTTIPISSATSAISNTIPISSTTPVSTTIPSIIDYSSTQTTSTSITGITNSSVLDTMTNSSNPQGDVWSSTEDLTTITALRHSYNDELFRILIGVLLLIALVAMVATIVIVCRVRKLRKHNADGIIDGNFWGRNSVCSFSTLLNNSYELMSRTSGCTAGPSTVVASPAENLSSTGQQNKQTKRQSSNYTPMIKNCPRAFSKTSLGTSVHADIEEIESKHDSVLRGSAASPPVLADTRDNVYYNTATDAASVQLVPRLEINAYETCYSPEIEGATSLNLVRSNSPAYASIDEYVTGVSDSSTGGQKGTVHDQDKGLYWNVLDQRGMVQCQEKHPMLE